jgi:hypothetical protein
LDRVWLGSQAFYGTSAFNANIGAWNTAAVSTMQGVCAAPGWRRATAANALGRCSMRRSHTFASTYYIYIYGYV